MGQGSLSQFIIVDFIMNMFKVKGDRFLGKLELKSLMGQ